MSAAEGLHPRPLRIYLLISSIIKNKQDCSNRNFTLTIEKSRNLVTPKDGISGDITTLALKKANTLMLTAASNPQPLIFDLTANQLKPCEAQIPFVSELAAINPVLAKYDLFDIYSNFVIARPKMFPGFYFIDLEKNKLVAVNAPISKGEYETSFTSDALIKRFSKILIFGNRKCIIFPGTKGAIHRVSFESIYDHMKKCHSQHMTSLPFSKLDTINHTAAVCFCQYRGNIVYADAIGKLMSLSPISAHPIKGHPATDPAAADSQRGLDSYGSFLAQAMVGLPPGETDPKSGESVNSICLFSKGLGNPLRTIQFPKENRMTSISRVKFLAFTKSSRPPSVTLMAIAENNFLSFFTISKTRDPELISHFWTCGGHMLDFVFIPNAKGGELYVVGWHLFLRKVTLNLIRQ